MTLTSIAAGGELFASPPDVRSHAARVEHYPTTTIVMSVRRKDNKSRTAETVMPA